MQSYYEALIKRQTLGYEESLLLVDQLSIHLAKDSATSSKHQMIDEILAGIAQSVSENKLPIGDILNRFDVSGSQQMYRSDFYSTFLDSQLKLQYNPKTGKGLSYNQKLLLTTKYAPTESVVRFPYGQFVDDLMRKQSESKGTLQIYMT